MTEEGAERLGCAYLRALDVVVGLPARAAPAWSGFPVAVPPADVVVDVADPAQLSGAVTHAVVERTRMLTVHAAVVRCAAGALVFPASSGSGKSTLAVALVRRGFGLMSDELAAFHQANGLVSPFPRPITLDVDSPATVDLKTSDALGGEVAVDGAKLGTVVTEPLPLAAVIVFRRIPSAVVHLEQVSRSEAVGSLIWHSFNHFRSPVDSLSVIASVLRTAEAFRLTYGEAEHAAALLSDRFPP